MLYNPFRELTPIRSAFNSFEKNFHATVSGFFNGEAKEKMDLSLCGKDGAVELSILKAYPGRTGLESILVEFEKLQFIRSLNLNFSLFQTISARMLKTYYQRISSESAWEIQQHPPAIRYSLLGIFFYFRQREIIDGLIELFIQIVHRLSVRAERKLVKELLSDFQKVYGKTTLLFRIAEAALLDPEGSVRVVAYPVAGENILQNLLKEFKSSGPGYKQHVHKIIRASYSSRYRRMVPKILESLTFKSGNTQHRPVLDALEWLQQHREQSQRFISLDEGIPIEGVIRPKWLDVVIEEEAQGGERINRIFEKRLRECFCALPFSLSARLTSC